MNISKNKHQDNIISICCGLVIRKIRKFHGVSANELAIRVNLSQQQISRYERGKNKISIDMLFNISTKIRSTIANSFTRNGHKKNSKCQDILGCTFEELKKHLESKFEDWMTWDNRGLYNGTYNYGWDIDHIMPLASAKTEEDIIRLNHYTNLQPLCSKVNREIKKDNY